MLIPKILFLPEHELVVFLFILNSWKESFSTFFLQTSKMDEK